MRPFAHWSWQYAFDRSQLLVYELTHPGWPWLAPAANAFLSEQARPGTRWFEWGAGRSTLWLANRGAQILSIEHDPKWHARVSRNLAAHGLHQAKVVQVKSALPDYIDPIDNIGDRSLDAVIVDGISEFRDACALAALPKVRPGGFILVDDAHRYCPAPSHAPNALSATADPPTLKWQAFIDQTKHWVHRRYTSGVTDTAVWTRPEAAH